MPKNADDSLYLTSRIEAAKAAVLSQRGRLEQDMGRVDSDWKADGSRVTETDHAISAAILGQLLAAFPDDTGLSEELLVDEPVEVASRFAWVLDPIDGTNNFATGMAQCAISLALFENGEPVYGVIYDVARRKLMHGGPGWGLWDGDQAVSVRMRALGRSSVVGFHSPHEVGKHPGHAEALVRRAKVRALGSSALHLAYVAAGLLDGVVDHNVKLWDIAAGIPMIRAGGGDVQFLANDPLPLRRFDLEMPRIFYVGGCSEVRQELAKIFINA
ncbi:MAG: inositol monophosphatase [Candidatus Synoicihabitans palmerolidicus]|nr:inositol monophosphatase [Candidatus Synoicihabitans palmerolidicus]